MHVSNRIRLIFIISIVLVVAFVAVSVFNYKTAKKSISEEIRSSSLPLLRENIYSEIRNDIIPAVNISSMMAADSFLKNWTIDGEENPEAVIQYLEEIHKKYGYFSTFFVSNISRNYYHYSGILKKISPEDDHDVWFFDFIDSGKSYELDVDTDEASQNKLTIFMNFRVEDYSGNILGVAGVGIEMEGFSGFLMDKQKKYSRRIYFTDPKGIVQAHSDDSMIESVSILQQPGIQEIAESLLVTDADPVDAVYELDHERILITSRYIPEIDWFLLVEQNENAALAPARENLWRTILIGLGTSIIIIAISSLTISFFQKRLEKQAITDQLTQAVNRRELERQFQIAVSRYERHKVPISIIVVDVDNFKNINDTQGHNQGDNVLVNLSKILMENIRPDDLLARWGGDEFIIMFESTVEEAAVLADRLMEALKQGDSPVTISMGIAGFTEGDSMESLVQKGDSALYQSKKEGRNRFSIFKKG